MELDQITRWKNLTAKTAAALCLFCILCALDGAVAYLREPFNSFRLLAGESIRLTGPMGPMATGVDQMDYESNSGSMAISLEEVASGFWMGGKMWRGTLTLAPDIEPGQYQIFVFGKEDRKQVGPNTFLVKAYKDRASYLDDSNSLILKYAGVSPWWGAGSFFMLVLLVCGGLFLISGRRDGILAERGEAEVFHVTKDETGSSIYFGLGLRHGVKEGSRLVLMNAEGQPVEEITAASVTDDDGTARVGPLCTVRPGDMVKKI